MYNKDHTGPQQNKTKQIPWDLRSRRLDKHDLNLSIKV